MIDHGALTDLILDHLTDALGTGPTDPLVGDGGAPAEGGWLHGQPGDGVFRPYAVLIAAGAVPRLAAGQHTISPTWAVGFSLRSFGGSRRQCDSLATAVRTAFAGLKGSRFGTDDPWKVINAEWVALGGTTRVDATAPPFWQVFDTVTLVCDS